MKGIEGANGRMGALWVLYAAVLVSAALWAVFQAPVAEPTTGGIAQKIFYFHVSAAWVAFLGFFIAAGYACAHLLTDESRPDLMRARAAGCYSAVEVSFVFLSLVLLTGPVWARPVWGVWWRWEPRLTTFLIMWVCYAAALVVRAQMPRREMRDRMMSVYAIAAFLNVPLVYASVLFWREENQMHPRRIGLAPEFHLPLWLSVAAETALFVALWNLRRRICLKEEMIREKS